MIKHGLDTDKVYTSNGGFKFRVVEFINSRKVKIIFDSGYEKITRPDTVIKGGVRDLLSPSDSSRY